METKLPPLSDAAQERLSVYADYLSSLGKHLGLVHLSSDQVVEQVGRSLALSNLIASLFTDYGPEKRLFDVGSGAGLPAVPVCIALEDRMGRGGIRPILIEPKRKAVGFLEKIIREIGLEAAVLAERAQTAAEGEHRAAGNIVTAKALARMPLALQWCAPLCKNGGFVLITGRTKETDGMDVPAVDDLHRLGLSSPSVASIEGPGGETQTVLVYRKRSLDGPAQPGES